jgi:hypothetical protein
MIMSEIVKWTFIVIMMAPLPILFLAYSFSFIKEKMDNHFSQDKQHQE